MAWRDISEHVLVGLFRFDSILALLDKLVPELGADPKRITLAGQSMGGNGAWMLAAKAPERFAAVVPVCGFAVRGRL